MNRRNFLKRVVAIPAALGLGVLGVKSIPQSPTTAVTTRRYGTSAVREVMDIRDVMREIVNRKGWMSCMEGAISLPVNATIKSATLNFEVVECDSCGTLEISYTDLDDAPVWTHDRPPQT